MQHEDGWGVLRPFIQVGDAQAVKLYVLGLPGEALQTIEAFVRSTENINHRLAHSRSRLVTGGLIRSS